VTNAQSPTHARSSWPGVDGLVTFSDGLGVGYRYYQEHGITPLFPFGFGLSYTSFSLGRLTVASDPTGYLATVQVTNTGSRSGTDIVQAYLAFPQFAGEPPEQLVAFAPVTLSAGASTTVALPISAFSFRAFYASKLQNLPGIYELSVGNSSADLGAALGVVAPPIPRTTPPGGAVSAASTQLHRPITP
jgi:beta-glucosidase